MPGGPGVHGRVRHRSRRQGPASPDAGRQPTHESWHSHGRRDHEAAARQRHPLRASDPSLESQDEAVHLHRPQRHLHHRPAADADLHRQGVRVRQRDRRPRRHGAVRRHQEAGAGIRRGRSDPRRHAVCQPALAGRHAHQLLHRAQAAAAPQGARGDGADRRLRGPHQEGDLGADPGEEQAGTQPRRYPRHGQGAVGDLGRRHQQGAHRRRRGPQAGNPGHRDPGHQLRPRRGRLPDPGQRRRDPLGRAADQGDRLRGRRGPAGPRRPGPR